MSSARVRVRVLRGYDGGAPEVAGASRTASGHVYIALGSTSMEGMSRLEQMMFISSVQFRNSCAFGTHDACKASTEVAGAPGSA